MPKGLSSLVVDRAMWSSDDPHDTYNNLVGRALPGYDIFHRFGESSVFAAFSWKLNRDVALKILTLKQAADPRLVKAFARQNKGLGQLPPDSNLVPVYAVGKVSELVVAIMDRIRGESIARFVSRNGPLTWKCVLEISIELARAMRSAQDLGLPDHRLHPERILLSMDGGVHVSLCSLPRGLGEGEVPTWAHLEDLRGEPAIEASDVYVAGMLFYYLAIGQPPFAGEDAEKVTNAQLWTMPDLGKLSALGAPPSFVSLAERALAKHPNDRYPNANSLMAAMKSVLNNDAPGYVLGSYREVIAQLVRDEEKDVAPAPPEPEVEPEPAGKSNRPSGRRPSTLAPSRRPSGAVRKTGGAAVISPNMARGQGTPRGIKEMRGGQRSMLALVLCACGGVLLVVLLLAFALPSGGNSREDVATPPSGSNGRKNDPDDGPGPTDPGPDPVVTDPDELYAMADAFEQRGRDEEALRIWNGLIAKNPEFKDVHWRRGSLLHGQGKLDEALADLDLHLARKPDDLPALQLRAQILEGQGKYAEAIEAFGQVLARDSKHYVALERRARLSEKRSDWASAALDYHLLVTLGVERQDIKDARARTFGQAVQDVWDKVNFGRGADPVALAEATDRLLQMSDAPLLRISRAVLLIASNSPEATQQAATHLDRAIAIYDQQTPQGVANPTRGMAYSYRVIVQARAQRPEQALIDARFALEDAVADTWAAMAFGVLAEVFKEKDPPRARVYELLKVALSGSGAEDEERLQQFLAGNPDLSLAPAALAPYVEAKALISLRPPDDWALQFGDVILAYNDRPTRFYWELRQAVLEAPPAGSRATLRVNRQGREIDVPVPAGEWRVAVGVRMTLK